MKCSKCGSPLSDGVRFCRECGEKVPEHIEVKFCRECGAKCHSGSKYCDQCGANLSIDDIGKDTQEHSNANSRVAETTKKNKTGGFSLKFIVLAIVVILLIIAAILVFAPKDQTGSSNTTSDANVSNNSSVDQSEVVQNYTIQKGTEYAFMSDEWNVYIATAISDDVITVDRYNKTSSNSKTVDFNSNVGTFKINDRENGFKWLDDEHMAFEFAFSDKNNSRVKQSAPHVFTVDINDSNKQKGSDYDKAIACYSYTNDDWHMYRAIPLSDHLIKIECWYRVSSMPFESHNFGWDWCVIDTNNSSTDFEWTDSEKTSFTITTKDPKNSYYWKNDTFVAFQLENKSYKFPTVKDYLAR